jgi:ATP-dependent exoDNAse (exonuclease V) beta subunit
VVYLFPDLSRAGDEQYQIAGSPRDSVIRVFYVGATRARETLYICGRETARSIAL